MVYIHMVYIFPAGVKGKGNKGVSPEYLVVCDYFGASSISLSIVHVSFVSFKPTAGVQPSVE